MSATADHPWKLVAPSYWWERRRVDKSLAPRPGPVFQKFDHPDFIRGFVRAPLHSLKFCEKADRVYRVRKAVVPRLGTRFRRLFVASKAAGEDPAAYDTQLCRTKTRKLYLDTHKRYYLVVCELHCDAPGFPSVAAGAACQAGFVVRRRSTDYPEHLYKDAAAQVDKVLAIQAEIGYLDGSTPLRGRPAGIREAKVAKLKAAGTLGSTVADLTAKAAAAETDLAKWKNENGVVPRLDGWVPGRFPNVGSWRRVAEEPTALTEAFFPLYRFFPDPKIADHPAAGRTVYYGVVPTSSLDTDDRGAARFDADWLYEIRCFVRRHAPECPRTKAVPDCHGPLVWSAPTEAYRLATPADLEGTSQRPVTIRMPDLSELAAQASALDLTKLAPVKVVQPQQLDFNVDDQKAAGGKVGDFPQICFFAIPLITLVAFFVLRLFLPILVFLFNLYFLLAFRLCILPSFKLQGGLDAKVDVIPGGVEVDAGVGATIGFTDSDLTDALRATVAAGAGVPDAPGGPLAQFSNDALLPLGRKLVAADRVTVAAGPDVTAGLAYEDDDTACPPPDVEECPP